MPSLSPGYDVAFFDGFGPTFDLLAQLRQLLRPGGLLISSNLTVGGKAAEVRAELAKSERWLTTFALESGRTAISLLLRR
jgi:predicted O-methyltransferase YrrM